MTRKNASKCILGVVVVAVFLALTWSTTAARLSSLTTLRNPAHGAGATTARFNSRIHPAARVASLSGATVETNHGDYQPGDIVEITGTGWSPGESVALRIEETDGDLPWESSATANSSGDIFNNQFQIQAHDHGVSFTLTATGSSGTATTTFTDNVSVDFRQSANNEDPAPGFPGGLGNIHWINSIVQHSNSIYFEGMSNLQRSVFTDVAGTPNDVHRLKFSHQFTKAGIHAYDFLTSYDQALADDAALLGVPMILNECGIEISAGEQATCNSLKSSGFFVDVPVPDDPFVSHDGSTAAKIAEYEVAAGHGNRTIRLWGDQAISNASLQVCHDVAAGGDTGDTFAFYVLTWTSTSTKVMVEMAGHLAVSGDGTGFSWGVGKGSSQINGGPYHFKLDELGGRVDDGSLCPVKLVKGDTSSLGSQDNQIKGADVLLPCSITGPTSACAGATNLQFSGPNGASSYQWSFVGSANGATFCSGTTSQTVCVTAGTGNFTLQLVLGSGPGSTTCTQSVTVNSITVTATPTNVLCNGGSTGSVNVCVSGGTAPYS